MTLALVHLNSTFLSNSIPMSSPEELSPWMSKYVELSDPKHEFICEFDELKEYICPSLQLLFLLKNFDQLVFIRYFNIKQYTYDLLIHFKIHINIGIL